MADYAVEFIIDDTDEIQSTVRTTNEIYIQRMRFIYNDKRCCSKLYILFKLMGILIYSYTLTACYNAYRNFFLGMISVMGVGLINSARYEYAHIKRFGTVFNGIYEFTSWKKTLWPKSRLFISLSELAIKIGYLIKIFPPTFDTLEFDIQCEIGTTIFKLHVIGIIILYILSTMFLTSMFMSFWICNRFNTLDLPASNNNNSNSNSSNSISNSNNNNSNILLPVTTIFPATTEQLVNECCIICLDDKPTNGLSMLRCGHTFHTLCIAKWLEREPSCPICRRSTTTNS